MEGEEVSQKVSKFSSGINIILRLDSLWRDTHSYSRNGKYILWNLTLDRIWLELCRDLEGDEFEKQEKKFKEFEEKLQEQMPISDNEPEGFKKHTTEDIKKRNKVYNILIKKQIFLARLENELGKGTTFDDGDEEDWE